MRTALITLAAAIGSVSANAIGARQDVAETSASSTSSGQPVVTAAAGSLALGAICSNTQQCANGAQCYGTTASTIRRCGNFNAACSGTFQCAYNVCNNGFCNGAVLSSTSSSATQIITGTAGSQPSGQPPVTAPAGSLPLGAICSDTRQCAGGAQCYGTTAFTIRRCGNFNAACSSTSQCAYNVCNNGFCNGAVLTSTSSSTTATETITGTAGSQPSGQPPITAPAGSLPLGAKCSDTRQCANGAQCYGTTAFTIRTCGSFNAACSSTSQCATNTCKNGFCNGLVQPSSNGTSTSASGPYSTPTPSAPIPYTGAGARIESGLFAFAAAVAGIAAWLL